MRKHELSGQNTQQYFDQKQIFFKFKLKKIWQC